MPPVASKMRPPGHHFRQKGPQRWSTPNESEPPEADLGATRGPKQPKVTFSSIQDRFWIDVGMDFRAIWARFRSNLNYHLWSLIRIPKNLLVEVFPRSFCMFHADSWYSIQACWYSIKADCLDKRLGIQQKLLGTQLLQFIRFLQLIRCIQLI